MKSVRIPGVAKFYETIECLNDTPPCSYIVQEYIEGMSLQKMIQDAHRFKVDDVYDILIQTLQILEKLHHHEPPIIHRDIKPSNQMITPDKNGKFKVTIIDFGAVANPQVQGGGSTVAGTFGYMPPEQLTGKPDPASDIYALAALGVQLFCGKSPAELPQKDFRLIFEPELQDRPHDLVVLLGQMVLMEPRVYPCHANCIEALCHMAFRDSNKKERCIEAFNLIKEYMKFKPKHLTAKACEEINMIKFYAEEYGFDSDLDNDFYELLLDILVDPDISIAARAVIAEDFNFRTPKSFMVKAYNIIERFDDNMIKDKAMVLERLYIFTHD